jgi:mono/diheme cytochrome c family protein
MRFLATIAGMFSGVAALAADPAPNPQAVEFFEARVRPLLADSCFSCHGPDKQKGGLRLDSRAELLKGSESGPVVVPGEPDKSPMIKAVRYGGDVHMPPKGKLPAEKIEALTAWVKMGAPFPDAAQQSPSGKPQAATDHWAFKPVLDPAPPAVQHAERVVNPIDRFVLATLEAKGLSLSSPADKRTLIRRVYFDLIGLPPTADEVDAFVKDPSPDAYAKLIEKLLASPHYGERWGRYWLDLSRYADTKGYVFEEDRNYPYAYTYRDWVIRAFNDDMPYDQFIVRQLAADRLAGEDRRHLAAMGFLTLGRRFLNNVHDIADDRIDVTARTFMGLTVTCARCHDHKFDPIPQKDYYSLYGVFASSVEPKELPLIGEVPRTPELGAFEAELKKREAGVTEFVNKRHAELTAKLREPATIAAYLVAVRDSQGKPDEQLRSFARDRDLSPAALGHWRMFLPEAAKQHPAIFGLLGDLAAISDGDFAAKPPPAIETALAGKKLNSIVADALRGQKPTSFKEVAGIFGATFAKALDKNAAKSADHDVIVEVLTGTNGPLNWPVERAEQLFNRADRNKLRDLQKRVDAFRATNPAAPPRAMALNDSPTPLQPVVFLRGNPNNPGSAVPRQFLEVLSGPKRKPFTDGSGRLELARAIASKDNPLTARVLVNRVWLHHFGYGLVRTPSDFGTRSDPPTHPELLDWLAARFVQSGWSVKQLHRLMVMSQTYQQSSAVTAESLKLDPENRLLARMNRRRLDFEALRESLLATAGHLDETVGGRPVDLFKEPFTQRRSVYGFIDRQNLPGTLRSFDFASPDTHSPQRFTTTVPQQALFLMNSPFVVAQAKALLARTEIAGMSDPAKRIEALYRLVHNRAPEPDEVNLALTFVEGPVEDKPGALSRWEELAQVLLSSNEFAFVD